MRKVHLLILTVCMCGVIFGQNFIHDLQKETWNYYEEYTTQKFPAVIPGTIHTDLFRNNTIPNPYFGDNEKKLQWIDSKTWIYETYFDVSEQNFTSENIELVCEGLDTYADVYLNGNLIVQSNNMFIAWNIPIKNVIQSKNNHLKIKFHSTSKIANGLKDKLSYSLPEGERVFARKAQYHFGWDWGPKFISCGIWKPIYLKFWDNVQLNDVHVTNTKIKKKKSKLEFAINVTTTKAGKYTFSVNDKRMDFELLKGNQTITIPYTVPNPILWWCNGLGEPYLYDFRVSLSQNDVVMAEKSFKYGIRTIELIQEKDSIGTSFYFKINGEKVFIKGANYIPPDHFVPNISPITYRELVQQAKTANMNMLRVWGGGVYPDEEFLKACDENGILIWQDFMFACAMYPGDEAFIESVKTEVSQQVNRMKNHASIALWCGNNEIEEGWHNWGWQKSLGYTKADSTKVWNDYSRLFHHEIPAVLNRNLGERNHIYWPSSPSKGWGRKEAYTMGDVHYWGVWWGMQPFESYNDKVGRFVSEYGFQSVSNKNIWKEYIETDSLHMQSLQVKNHQKHPRGWETISTYMERDFPVPSTFEDYIYVSQLVQARGMKIAIEAHRKAMPNCMGTLYWQLNDSWPAVSWSTVEYSLQWKAAHYQVKRSYENVMVTADINKDKSVTIYGINDTKETIKGNITVTCMDFDGNIINEHQFNSLSELKPKTTTKLGLILDFIPENMDVKTCFFTIKFKNNHLEKEYIFYAVSPKELLLNREVDIEITQIDSNTISLSSNTLVKDLYLESNNVKFEDNYFDLVPKKLKLIKVNCYPNHLIIKYLNNITNTTKNTNLIEH